MIARFPLPGRHDVALCVLHAGTYAVEQSDGRQYRFYAGQLFMLDCGRMMRSQRNEWRASYLRLSRSLVHEAMGRDPGVLGRIAFLLDHAQPAPFLQAQMAQLYRPFGEQSMSVGETIKEARLARSLRYLQAGNPQLSIGEIADMCGFSDQSAFGKQFRKRFAFTPGEARHASASDAVAA